MKKITKRSAAVFAAAVMTFSAVSIAAYAKGWTETENGKKFITPAGEELSSGKYSIGGTIYEFSEEGYCLGKFTGWLKTNGVKRLYKNGKSYTGWIKSDGSKKYTLDGYLVTDEIQVDYYSYSFYDVGGMSGETGLDISAEVVGKITPDTETITIKLTKLTDGNAQSFGAPALLERWEKGQWVDCFADLEVNVPMTMELYSLSGKGETLELEFHSIARTGYKLTPGFYRIPINNSSDMGFGQPIAVLSEDGTVTPVSGESTASEPTVAPVSTYAMFEVVAK